MDCFDESNDTVKTSTSNEFEGEAGFRKAMDRVLVMIFREWGDNRIRGVGGELNIERKKKCFNFQDLDIQTQ